jgi:hypothetical protein
MQCSAERTHVLGHRPAAVHYIYSNDEPERGRRTGARVGYIC